jgi:putative ATPase
MDLFDKNLSSSGIPLAERLRPKALADFVGQKHLLGEGALLRTLIERDEIPSMIFWGPPGTGKTTLAEIIAKMTGAKFTRLEATHGGKADLKKIVEEALGWLKFHNKRTILFIDEIHRWNKAQQDALLPYVEKGLLTLIGATTENPSFEVVGALLSRSQVFVLNQLSPDELLEILKRALRLIFSENKIKISFEEGAPALLLGLAGGDARSLLGALELLLKTKKAADNVILLRKEDIKNAYLRANVFYDKDGEDHYNIISALHKSMRGSDPDAALYWLGRMLESGDDPLYVARRLVRFASEDIGLADPHALVQAVSAYQAAHFLGMPECNVILAQATAYLAKAPKSNALYRAYGEVQRDIKELPRESVPLHLRNAPTDLMKDLGYGKNYKYNPNFNEPVEQDYMPPGLKGRKYLK